jgi:hypothetical protein
LLEDIPESLSTSTKTLPAYIDVMEDTAAEQVYLAVIDNTAEPDYLAVIDDTSAPDYVAAIHDVSHYPTHHQETVEDTSKSTLTNVSEVLFNFN